MLSKRYLSALILLVASPTVGCQQAEEKITRTTVPRLNNMKRILVAILAAKDGEEENTWFFKVTGTESALEPLVEPFEEFLKSVRFDTPNKPTFTTPKDWHTESGNENRYATIHTGPKGTSPELTVTALRGEKAASLPENVIRWRIQLGLKGDVLGSVDLEPFYRPVPIGDRTGILVDMIGPGGAGRAKEAPAEDLTPREAPFKYKVPDGWKKVPPGEFSVLSLVARDKDKRADITVSVLQGQGGGLKANVDRWCKQVGHDDLTSAQLAALPEVPIGNLKGKLVNLTRADQTKGILGAILMRENDSLFFKMTGPSDFVREQQHAFETFLKSVNFER